MRPLSQLAKIKLDYAYFSEELRDSVKDIDDDLEGFFALRANDGQAIRIIATIGGGWDHVSVSCEQRCPTWDEMEIVKRLFFLPEEPAMQLHPPLKDYVNCHPYCLHIWRPHVGEIPMPPKSMVGGIDV